MFQLDKQDLLNLLLSSCLTFPVLPLFLSPTCQIIIRKFIITAKVKHYYPEVSLPPPLWSLCGSQATSVASFVVMVLFLITRKRALYRRLGEMGRPDQEIRTVCANLMNSPYGCRLFNFHSSLQLILLHI